MIPLPNTEVDNLSMHVIAAGMRHMASIDGYLHPAESALIEAFCADLPGEAHETVELEQLANGAAREAFLKSLLMVAMVDGDFSSEEKELIHSYSECLGYSADQLKAFHHEVGRFMLAEVFGGVKLFREQVKDIAVAMGLDASIVDEAL